MRVDALGDRQREIGGPGLARRDVEGELRAAARGGRSRTARQLLVTGGALTGTRISLDSRPILIGRADDSTLVLDDDYASTRHARIAPQGDDWYVEDLGSTNGTYLDQLRVQGPTLVNPGQPIRIGQTALELRT